MSYGQYESLPKQTKHPQPSNNSFIAPRYRLSFVWAWGDLLLHRGLGVFSIRGKGLLVGQKDMDPI